MTPFIFSIGASKLNLMTRTLGGTRYGLAFVFTTQDGEWFQSDKPYSIPQWALTRYDKPEFMERGAATHIFVRCEDTDGTPSSALVQYNSTSTTTVLSTGEKPSGWQNLPIFESYDPTKGERGPWSVSVDGGDYAVDGLGLPNHWHVSTFLVYQKMTDLPKPTEKPTASTWPVREISLTEPTILRVSGGVPFDLEVR